MITLDAVRDRLARARERAAMGSDQELLRELDELLEIVTSGVIMLTTADAAKLLGIRSVNTIKALIHAGRIDARKVGSHYRIPLVEIARLLEDRTIQGLQASSRLHATLETLGPTEELTAEELSILTASQPGVSPWKRAGVAAADVDAARDATRAS